MPQVFLWQWGYKATDKTDSLKRNGLDYQKKDKKPSKGNKGNSNTMILNGDEGTKSTVNLQIKWCDNISREYPLFISLKYM